MLYQTSQHLAKGTPLIPRKKTSRIILSHAALLALVILIISSKPHTANASSAFSTTTNAAVELDACKLVTKAEAEQAMGEKLKDPDSGPASTAGGTICRYESPESLSAKNVTIRVESPNFNWAKFKEDRRIEGEKMQPKRGRIRPVPGLGKEA